MFERHVDQWRSDREIEGGGGGAFLRLFMVYENGMIVILSLFNVNLNCLLLYTTYRF
jgi:hypothetical protein